MCSRRLQNVQTWCKDFLILAVLSKKEIKFIDLARACGLWLPLRQEARSLQCGRERLKGWCLEPNPPQPSASVGGLWGRTENCDSWLSLMTALWPSKALHCVNEDIVLWEEGRKAEIEAESRNWLVVAVCTSCSACHFLRTSPFTLCGGGGLVCAHTAVYYMHAVPGRPEGVGPPGNGVLDGCEPPYGYWA